MCPDTHLAEASRLSTPIGAFANTYAVLPARFFSPQLPAQVAAPRLVRFNEALARELNLDVAAIMAAGPAQIFSGNLVPEGAVPIAQAYAGHQFGGFSPQLGDGRAILLGDVLDRAGALRDIQLKGSGRTAFSRGGDGRAALGPVLREYILSEAMHALGIPTTRALAAVTTGETVYRERALPGAVFTRVAASHVRVGTFQYFAARGDQDAVRILADFVIGRHYPAARDAANPYLALLEGVVARQARLVAQWMGVGFIHGVMNTDNTSVSGETIDYGPCAFMEAYDPAAVFSAIDEGGRYSYSNQPRMAQWNLARLAETLLGLIDPVAERAIELATAAINAFSELFDAHSLAGMRAKLGLAQAEESDRGLIAALLRIMAQTGSQTGAKNGTQNGADFTLTFRRLADLADGSGAGPRTLFADPAAFDDWAAAWHARLGREEGDNVARAEAMRRVNPAFIARNHRVEAALEAAIEREDFAPFGTLLAVLARPFEDQPGFGEYAEPAPEAERVLRTFCGT
jgi:uncharacterized protein YdiU (UPF0061 family)